MLATMTKDLLKFGVNLSSDPQVKKVFVECVVQGLKTTDIVVTKCHTL